METLEDDEGRFQFPEIPKVDYTVSFQCLAELVWVTSPNTHFKRYKKQLHIEKMHLYQQYHNLELHWYHFV